MAAPSPLSVTASNTTNPIRGTSPLLCYHVPPSIIELALMSHLHLRDIGRREHHRERADPTDFEPSSPPTIPMDECHIALVRRRLLPHYRTIQNSHNLLRNMFLPHFAQEQPGPNYYFYDNGAGH
jgi:hypothetical protein